MLFLRDDGTLLVGEAASRRAVGEPSREARDFKRRMGDDVPIRMGDQTYTPQELTGHLLRWAVDAVSEREGGRPGHVVLTCPAEWGDYRRGLLVEAAAQAGLDDVGLLPEPVAAATWYAAQERVTPDSFIAVYDLGGGTFDASVVRKTDTGFEIHGEAGGDDAVGGIDFDHALLRHVASVAGVDLGRFDPEDGPEAAALAQLFAAVVEAKEALSADIEAVVPVVLPGVTTQVTVTRGQFEDLVRAQITGTVQLFGQIVRRAGVDPAQLRATLLVGGSSRIPLVTRLLHSELGTRVAVDTHPKYAVSLGAAIAAAPRVDPSAAATAAGLAPAAPETAPPPVDKPAWDGPTTDLKTVPAPELPPEHALVIPLPGAPKRPEPEPPVDRPVNLAVTGLTAPTDVKVVLPPPKRIILPVVTDRDDRVVVRTRDGGGNWGRRVAALALGVAVVAAAAVAVVVIRRDGGSPSPKTPPPPGGRPAAASPSTVGSATFTGTPVSAPPGVDAMRAVTALPSGDFVAVGVSVDLHPRAWVRHGVAWRVTTPTAPAQGAMAGVTVNLVGGKPKVVAVGSVPAVGGARPAVWVSDNGDKWRLLDAPRDLGATGVHELTAVVALAGGGFLATAVDKSADPDNGDAAVFRATDGTDWKRVPATGLDGAGAQLVQRITQLRDGRLVAVGSALHGARLVPVVWTSADGVGWNESEFAVFGDPLLWTVTQLPDATLFACGSLGPAEASTVGCWLRRDPAPTTPNPTSTPWLPYTVVAAPGSASPATVHDLIATPAGLLAVGVGRDASGPDAAAWTVTLRAG